MAVKTKKWIAVLLFVLLGLTVLFPVFTTHAGISTEDAIDDTSINGKIDPAYWWLPGDNPGVGYDGGIAFNSESKAYSRIVAIRKIDNFKEAGYDKCFSAEFELQIQSIPEGGRFGFFFGLSRQTGNPAAGGANTSFVYFATQNGKLMCGISNYVGADREEEEVQPETDILPWVYLSTEKFKLILEVDVNGGICVYIRQGSSPNVQAFVDDENAGCFTEGYIGFGQTVEGSVAVISQVLVRTLNNETPQNSDIFTRFEGDKFNVNELYTRNTLYDGGSTYIRPENGKLVFKNTKNGYLSTVYSYSNFEMELEIEGLRRTPVFNDDFTLQTSITTGISVAFAKDYQSSNLNDSLFYVRLSPSVQSPTRPAEATAITLMKGDAQITSVLLPESYHLWSERISQGRNIRLKVTLTDGMLSVFVGFEGDTNYYKGLEYDLDDVTPGYIQIVSSVTDFTASVCDNFGIGLISIKNTDYNGEIVTLTNKDNTVQVYDYEYYDGWDDSDLLYNTREAQ